MADDKFTRRTLFPRLGAGLAGLWACLRGRAPAATTPPPPAPAAVPASQETVVTTYSSYDCSPATFVSTTFYDGHGRVVEQRSGSHPQDSLALLPPRRWQRRGSQPGDPATPPDDA